MQGRSQRHRFSAILRAVLVGDAKQPDTVDAGKPFYQLQKAGMKTTIMAEIMRQRDPALKEAVESSLAGDVACAFDKLGESVAEVMGCVMVEWSRKSRRDGREFRRMEAGRWG